MNIPFAIVVRPIDERNMGNRESSPTPHQLVYDLAHAKMDHLLQEITIGNCREELLQSHNHHHRAPEEEEEYVILTADQVVTCRGQILEKPDNLTEAKSFVTQYGTHPCTTVGCVVLQHYPSRVRVYDHHTATIHFATTLTPTAASQLVDALVADQAPVLACAGGLMIEHALTQQYVERVEGSPDSVMGLDKATVTALLHELRQQLDESRQPPLLRLD